MPSSFLLATSFVLFCIKLPSSNGAQTDLLGVFRLEKHVADVLEDFKIRTERKLMSLQRFAQEAVEWREEASNQDENILESLVGNPLDDFHLLETLERTWKELEDDVETDDWKDTQKKIEQAKSLTSPPRDQDLYAAAHALIRIQDVYEMDPAEIAAGNVLGIKTQAVLNDQDCLYLGNHSYNAGLYNRAVQWFQQSHLLASAETKETLIKRDVRDFVRMATQAHDDTLRSGAYSEHVFPELLSQKSAAIQRQEILENRQYTLGESKTPRQENDNFRALCRGEKLMGDLHLSKLRCWLDSRNNPYFLLMPVRVERNSLSLPLYTFHNVITDKEIEVMEQLAKPRLSQAMVQGNTPDESLVSNVRTSQVSWLSENQHPLLDKLANRISGITGLHAKSTKQEAEVFQVANYGIGGHYNPHYDYLLQDKTPDQLKMLEPRDVAMGDRIATFMLYLSDVTEGGATVFPRIGAAIRPSKGAAAFWYNFKKSGKPDRESLHGACPVAFGHKWVSNKWIRESAQVFTRRCSEDMNE